MFVTVLNDILTTKDVTIYPWVMHELLDVLQRQCYLHRGERDGNERVCVRINGSGYHLPSHLFGIMLLLHQLSDC